MSLPTPTVDQEILEDPAEYDAANVFVVPEEASWDTLRRLMLQAEAMYEEWPIVA